MAGRGAGNAICQLDLEAAYAYSAAVTVIAHPLIRNEFDENRVTTFLD